MILIQILLLILIQYGESDPTTKQELKIIQELGVENWTSCEEFLKNTTFDIESVIDIDWKVFYFWNPEEDYKSYNIKFSKSTSILVDRFKVELSDRNLTIEWDNAVLFMETSIDFSALYLTTEVSGKFRLIPSFAFHMDNIPLLMFGLKVVKPGYLGIMNCPYRLCYALAPADKMPHTQDIKLAAEKLGFRGDQNRSYLYRPEPPPLVRPDHDDDDDEPLEVANYLDIED